ncbi:DUF1566 domain-containing protein [bacterium]|nr:DUF1566 domain-containing protein [bacterium]
MKKLFVVFALIFVSSMLFAESSDEMACKFARKVGTVDVWKNYLETFPGGSCAFEAESFMKMNKQATPREMETNNPQDVSACSMARQKNRPDVWRIYLESYPHGVCAFEAKMAITDLESKARADQERAEKEKAEAEKRTSCDSKPRKFPCIESTTGYMWSQQAPQPMEWSEAINYCKNLNQGGFSDWQLPSLNLLKTLIGNGSSKLGDTSWFWSSSPRTYDTALFVDFSEDEVGYTYKSGSSSVRCVRW